MVSETFNGKTFLQSVSNQEINYLTTNYPHSENKHDFLMNYNFFKKK
jgi:hypothetical protein